MARKRFFVNVDGDIWDHERPRFLVLVAPFGEEYLQEARVACVAINKWHEKQQRNKCPTAHDLEARHQRLRDKAREANEEAQEVHRLLTSGWVVPSETIETALDSLHKASAALAAGLEEK